MPGLRRSRGVLGVTALLLGLASAAVTGVPASAAVRTGTVYVLQGLRGVSADVEVDGARVASTVPAATVVGPLRLPAGRHVVALSGADGRLTTAGVTVRPGGSVDVLGYWAAETPATARLVLLPNDLSPVRSGATRLVVTHGIAGPPADIRVDGRVLVRSVAGGESLTLVVAAGRYRVGAAATIGGRSLLPETGLAVPAGTLTRAVAIGAPGGPPGVLVHVLPLRDAVSGARAPSEVRTGDGGQAASLFAAPAQRLSGLPRLPFAALATAFLLLALVLARPARRAPGSRHAR